MTVVTPFQSLFGMNDKTELLIVAVPYGDGVNSSKTVGNGESISVAERVAIPVVSSSKVIFKFAATGWSLTGVTVMAAVAISDCAPAPSITTNVTAVEPFQSGSGLYVKVSPATDATPEPGFSIILNVYGLGPSSLTGSFRVPDVSSNIVKVMLEVVGGLL